MSSNEGNVVSICISFQTGLEKFKARMRRAFRAADERFTRKIEYNGAESISLSDARGWLDFNELLPHHEVKRVVSIYIGEDASENIRN